MRSGRVDGQRSQELGVQAAGAAGAGPAGGRPTGAGSKLGARVAGPPVRDQS
jgi:hypothetical protein